MGEKLNRNEKFMILAKSNFPDNFWKWGGGRIMMEISKYRAGIKNDYEFSMPRVRWSGESGYKGTGPSHAGKIKFSE